MRAAEQLFLWAEHNLSQADGSYFNDIDSDWKGTTVFNTIQLADCLLFHGGILSGEVRQLWKNRLELAAEFLCDFDELKKNNINYPISNALALYECGMIWNSGRYFKKAKELADLAREVITEDGLLAGEGIPHLKKSPRGCYPIDIGYNVEETLPSLALYASLSKDVYLLDLAEKGLRRHLDYMLQDGGWDNSFGTRNYKWTYWGSRTSDGCALGYLLLAGKNPEFGLAAERNLQLLRQCTVNGLLMGGPHYQSAGQGTCVHHTFTHAKVLAGILERHLCVEQKGETTLPRQRVGERYDKETGSWIVNWPSMTATITSYDWEYLPGGHAGGGTLSLLYHSQAGMLLCSGVCQYMLKEPNNMQVPRHVRHECLALRIEKRGEDGLLYSSLYEDCAQITREGNRFIVNGGLKDIHHRYAPGKHLQYRFCYQLEEHRLTVQAEFSEGCLICPVVSRKEEPVLFDDQENFVRIQKDHAVVTVRANGVLSLPYGTERIFNLIPGFQALRMEVLPTGPSVEGCVEVQLELGVECGS